MPENLRVWIYARCGVTSPQALFRQALDIINYVSAQGGVVIGSTQELSTGSGTTRPALVQALKAIEDGRANALAVYNLDRISYDPDVQYLVLCFLQDHNAVLITTEMDAKEIVAKAGLEKTLLLRARKTCHPAPWLETGGDLV